MPSRLLCTSNAAVAYAFALAEEGHGRVTPRRVIKVAPAVYDVVSWSALVPA